MVAAKTDSDIKFHEKLNQMVLAGNQRTSEFKDMAKAAVRYVYGDQHAGKKRKVGWEYPVINRMYSDILQEVAILSSNNPRIEAVPIEDTDIDAAKAAGSVLQGMWNVDLRMRLKIIQALVDDHIYGIKIAKTFWEPKKKWNEDKALNTGNGWEGAIEVNIVKPEYFFCDPNVELAVEIPTKAEFCGTERWVDKLWAANRWPKYRKALEETGEYERLLTNGIGGTVQSGLPVNETNFNRTTNAWSGRDQFDEKTIQSRLSDILLSESEDGDSVAREKDDRLVKIQEIYFKDYETEHVAALMADEELGQGEAVNLMRDPDTSRIVDKTKPLTGEDGESLGFEQFKGKFPSKEARPAFDKPKYPNGRMVIRLDNDIIVEDVAYQYRRWPFAVSVHYMLPHVWNGVNAVELSRGFQDWMNTIASHMTNYIKYFSDPVALVEDGALSKGSEKKKKTFVPNWAGAVIRLTKGAIGRGAFKRESPPSLPQSLFQLFDMFKEADQDLKGIHDVAQGKAAGGETTLGEVQLLNRNTRQRVAMQGAFLDEWLNQIANQLVDLMQIHLKPDQWVRYAGETQDTVGGTLKWTQQLADAKFDVSLEAASTLPTDEERDIAKYLQAYEIAGPSMLEETLKKMKIQNVDEILQKHQVVGPLQIMMQLAQEAEVPFEQLVSMIQTQIELLTDQVENPQAVTSANS